MTQGFDLDEIERLLAAATPGEWAYRPDEYDDWGLVKSPPREVGNYEPPFITRDVIGQFRDPDARDEESLNEHRRNGTDPWYANAALIVAAHNSLPAILTEIRKLRAENARLREMTATNKQAWDNVLELGLIPERHRNTVQIMSDGCRAALGEPQ